MNFASARARYAVQWQPTPRRRTKAPTQSRLPLLDSPDPNGSGSRPRTTGVAVIPKPALTAGAHTIT